MSNRYDKRCNHIGQEEGSSEEEYIQKKEFNAEPYERAAAGISFTLASLIICLNSLIIYKLHFVRGKNRLHFYVQQVAIADLLVGLVNVLGDGIQSSMYGAWYGGDVLCRIWRFSKIVLSLASNFLLIGLGVDRLFAVKKPLSFVRYGSVCAKGFVIGSWVLGIVIGAFFLYYSKGENGPPNVGNCNVTIPHEWNKPYFWTVLSFTYLFPLLIITMCYTGICITIWKKWRKGLQLSEMHNDASQDILQDKRKNIGFLPRAKVKSIKMTLIICLAFVLCWFPYFVFMLVDIYHIQGVDQRVIMLIGMLYPLNSAVNPFIYIMFNINLFWNTREEHTMLCEGATQTASI